MIDELETKGGFGVPPNLGLENPRDLGATLENPRDAEATLKIPRDAEATWEDTLVKRQGFYLPHWTKDGAIYHSVFRLADSLPQTVLAAWVAERDALLRVAGGMTDAERKRLEHLVSAKSENFLDAGHGACLMKDPVIAKIVADALTHFDGERYRLHAWCVMPSHVHAVVEPLPGHALSTILQSWKSFTAHAINKVRATSGKVWQKKAYDHIIRSEASYARVVQYVLDNPKKAGLQNWQWVGKSGFGVPPNLE